MAIVYVDTLSQLNDKVSNNSLPGKINFMNALYRRYKV